MLIKHAKDNTILMGLILKHKILHQFKEYFNTFI